MKILFMSQFGEGFGLAYKMAEEGHDVFLYIHEAKYRNKGFGYKNPKQVPDYRPFLKEADLVLFDMSGLGKLADVLRKAGYPVGWGSDLADKLEKDRAYACSVIKKYTDADLPDWKKFTDIQAGIKFLEDKEETYVFKPLGDSGTALTFVPKQEGNAALIDYMSFIPSKPEAFILQEKVKGIEISTEGFFNGIEWTGVWNHTLEHKRFMEGDKGANCGCMGNFVWRCYEDELVKRLLVPLAPILREYKFVGSLDVNAIVTEDEVFFLEFTPRMGYDSTQAWGQLLDDKAGFYKSVIDKSNYTGRISDKFSFAVRLSMPPYPYSEDKPQAAKDFEAITPIEFKPVYENNIWRWDWMFWKGKECLAGTDGIVGTVNTLADKPYEAIDEAYQIIDRITLLNDVQYRKDIGCHAMRDILDLEDWGYLHKRLTPPEPIEVAEAPKVMKAKK